MSNIPEDTNDIVVPPFPYSEEDEKVAELNTSTEKSHKGKGINQSELFTLEKSINGNPKPETVRKFAQQWRYFIKNYGERKDGRVYIKVDGARTPIAHILFNDKSEHAFRIQCHTRLVTLYPERVLRLVIE